MPLRCCCSCFLPNAVLNQHHKLSWSQFGDSATLVYYLGTSSPKLLVTLNCTDGAPDRLYGGPGAADYIIGGAYNDYIEGNDGMDLVFGDHAKIDLFPTSHKLLYAQTVDFECTGGDDTIYLGSADDIVSGRGQKVFFPTWLKKG